MLAFKPFSLLSMAAGMIGSYWYVLHGSHGLERSTSFLDSLWESIERDRADFESGEYLRWGEKRDDF